MPITHLGNRIYFMMVGALIFGTIDPFFVSSVVVAQGPDAIDICEVVARSDQFNKKQVRVRAKLQTVVIEGGMWLVGDSCSRDLIALEVPETIRKHPEQHPDYAAMEDAILKQGNVGTVGKSITGTFSGKFVYARKKRPKRVLILDGVENLETSAIATQNKDSAASTQ